MKTGREKIVFLRQDDSTWPRIEAGTEEVDRLLRSALALPPLQPSILLRQRLRRRIAEECPSCRPLWHASSPLPTTVTYLRSRL
jgi:hypothetical protein